MRNVRFATPTAGKRTRTTAPGAMGCRQTWVVPADKQQAQPNSKKARARHCFVLSRAAYEAKANVVVHARTAIQDSIISLA
jgi:hypothetical protein